MRAPPLSNVHDDCRRFTYISTAFRSKADEPRSLSTKSNAARSRVSGNTVASLWMDASVTAQGVSQYSLMSENILYAQVPSWIEHRMASAVLSLKSS